MKKLITREQVVAECATFARNLDLDYIRDTHIEAAGWQWMRPAFGTAMFDDIGNNAREFTTWTSGATYTSGQYVVHRYEEAEVINAGLYVNASGGNNGEPQDTTGDFTATDFYTSATYNNLNDNGLEKAMAWATMAEALVNLHYKSGGHGIMTDSPEFETEAIVKRQMEQCQKYVEMYLHEAHEYICANEGDFPLYSPKWSNSKSHSSGMIFYDSGKQGAITYGIEGWRDYFNDMWAARYPI